MTINGCTYGPYVFAEHGRAVRWASLVAARAHGRADVRKVRPLSHVACDARRAEAEMAAVGAWVDGATVPDIAAATGLTAYEVRRLVHDVDGPPADTGPRTLPVEEDPTPERIYETHVFDPLGNRYDEGEVSAGVIQGAINRMIDSVRGDETQWV